MKRKANELDREAGVQQNNLGSSSKTSRLTIQPETPVHQVNTAHPPHPSYPVNTAHPPHPLHPSYPINTTHPDPSSMRILLAHPTHVLSVQPNITTQPQIDSGFTANSTNLPIPNLSNDIAEPLLFRNNYYKITSQGDKIISAMCTFCGYDENNLPKKIIKSQKNVSSNFIGHMKVIKIEHIISVFVFFSFILI